MTAMSHPPHVSHRHLLAALAAAVVIGAILVFSPTPALPAAAVRRLSRVLVSAGFPWAVATGVADACLNVALFVPWSFAAALLWRRVHWWQWVAVGYLVSAFIEWTQWLFLAARSAQALDLVANTVGAAIGAGACAFLRRGSPPDTLGEG